MDTNSSRPGDLNDLERRLAAWKPATEELNHEAMLFAAGRASARGGKGWIAWAVVSGCLAVTTLVRGALLSGGRSEPLAQLRDFQQRPPQPPPAFTPVPEQTPAPDESA